MQMFLFLLTFSAVVEVKYDEDKALVKIHTGEADIYLWLLLHSSWINGKTLNESKKLFRRLILILKKL